MTKKEAGPAKVVSLAHFVNDIEIAGERWEGDNYAWADRINSALAPLVAKAQAADEMAKTLKSLLGFVKEHTAKQAIKRVLAAYASANGGEGK
jgi:hypothetical protein